MSAFQGLVAGKGASPWVSAAAPRSASCMVAYLTPEDPTEPEDEPEELEELEELDVLEPEELDELDDAPAPDDDPPDEEDCEAPLEEELEEIPAVATGGSSVDSLWQPDNSTVAGKMAVRAVATSRFLRFDRILRYVQAADSCADSKDDSALRRSVRAVRLVGKLRQGSPAEGSAAAFFLPPSTGSASVPAPGPGTAMPVPRS